jgi:hypothetical protein
VIQLVLVEVLGCTVKVVMVLEALTRSVATAAAVAAARVVATQVLSLVSAEPEMYIVLLVDQHQDYLGEVVLGQIF